MSKLLRIASLVLFSALTSFAAPVVVGTIDPAPGPDLAEARMTVHDPARGRIFAIGQGNGMARVQALDATTGLVLGAVEMPFIYFASLALDSAGGRLFVASQGDNSDFAELHILDTATLAVVKTINTGLQGAWTIAFNATTQLVYLQYHNGYIVEVNPANDAVRILRQTDAGLNAEITVNPVTNKLYVRSASKVYVLDPVANTQLALITVANFTVTDLFVDAVANKVYLSGREDIAGSPAGRARIRVVDGANDTVTGTIFDLGDGTLSAVCFDPAANVLYATGQLYANFQFTYSLFKVNAGTGVTATVAATPPNEGAAATFNATTGSVLIHAGYGSRIVNVNVATGVAGSITHGYAPYAVAVDPATGKVFIRDGGWSELIIADGATRAVTARVPVGGPCNVGNGGLVAVSLAVNSSTSRAYTSAYDYAGNTENANVVVVDTTSGTVVATIPIVSADSNRANITLAVDEGTDRIFVAYQDYSDINAATTGRLAVIDGTPGSPTANTVIATINIASSPIASAFNIFNNRLYVAHRLNGNNLSVIDTTLIGTATNPVLAQVNTGASSPYGLAVNPVTNRIYIANSNGLSLGVISGVTHAIIGSVNINTTQNPYSDGLFGVAVDPATNRIYVTDNANDSRAQSTLNVIDGATNTIITLGLEVGLFAKHVAVNPATHQVYVAMEYGTNVTVVNDPAPASITTLTFPANGGQLLVSGGVGPFTFSVVGADGVLTSELPTGQTLTADGLIEGFSDPGTYTLVIRVAETNDPNSFSDMTFTFTVPGTLNSLKVEMRTRAGSEIRQGGLVDLEFTIKNSGAATLKDVRFHLKPLNGDQYINFVIQEGFGVLGFLDADGVPGVPPIDPSTGKRAKLPGSNVNPRLSFNAQGIEYADFGLGSMKGGTAIKVHAYCRIAYDWPVGETLRFDGGSATCKLNRRTTIQGRVAPRDFVVVGAAPGAARPHLALAITQLAAGELPEDKSVVIVTRAGLGVPDVKPPRLSNQITYRATYFNFGAASAAYVRLVLPIPPNTAYKAGSARLRIGAGDPIEAGKPKVFGNLLIFNVENVEKNFPFNPGSAKTLEYTVTLAGSPKPPVGTRITHLGGSVTSRELRNPATTLRQNVAQVVEPSRMTYESTSHFVQKEGEPADSAEGTVYHRIFFHNQGDLAAKQAGIKYTVPPGLAFQSAGFVKLDGGADISRNSAGITAPAVGATSGDVIFPIGTVKKNRFGFAQVVLKLDAATRPGGATSTETPDSAYRSEALFIGYDTSTASPAAAPFAGRTAAAASVRRASHAGTITEQHRAPDLARTFILQAGPASVERGGDIFYQVAWGNMSDVTAGVGGMYFGIPEGTEFVRASGTDTFGNPFNDDAIYRGPGEKSAYPNGFVIWVTSLARNSVKTATVQVRVKAGHTGPIFSEQLQLGLDQSGVRFGARIGTAVLLPGIPLEAQQKEIYAATAGRLADAAVGTAAAPSSRFLETIKQIATHSRSIGIAAADYVHISGNDSVAIPLGGNRMVAAGSLNLITPGTAGLVAAGGLNLVAAGGGNLTLAVPGSASGSLTATQLITSAPSLVAAGSLNLVAAGGLNLLQKVSVIGQNGASLIGLDGSTLIGLDGATLGTFSQKAGLTASFAPTTGGTLSLAANAASLAAANGGSLGFAKGGNLIGLGIANVLPPASLVGNDGASLVGLDGGTLVGNDGAGLVGQDGGTLVGNDGAGLRGSGSGSLISGSSGRVVPTGAGN